MDALSTVKAELGPLLDEVVELLGAERNAEAQTFFVRARTLLEGASSELDLMVLLGQHLAASAPVAFATNCSERALARIDRLLEKAEAIARTFSAEPETSH